MGVPLSSYTILKFLADGDEKNRVHHKNPAFDLALEALENYSVFAFIIHDPVIHKDFHEYLKAEFRNLHYTSGDHLVFFGLVDTPKAYSLTSSQPFYGDIREMLELAEEQENLEDQSYTAFAIANSLNIEPDMLPAIIVTHDTRLRSYKLYKTCPDKMETQIARLAGVSKEMSSYKKHEKLPLDEKQHVLYQLLDERDLDLCNGSRIIKLNESMAKAISEVFSFLIDSLGEHNNIIRIASTQKRNSLHKLTLRLNRLKTNLGQIDTHQIENHPLFPVIEELSIKLATFLALSEKNIQKQRESVPICPDWLEQHSVHLLETALAVEAFLHSMQHSIDYSASAICLGKMFEQEINYSFVHLLRKQQSIELPTYYNKVQPGVRALVSTKPSSEIVDLNRNRHGRWAAPELGKSKALAKYEMTPHDWTSIGIYNSHKFLTEWDIIHPIRNKAAHTDIVSLQDLEIMKTSLLHLEKEGIFKALSNLKRSLKAPALSV